MKIWRLNFKHGGINWMRWSSVVGWYDCYWLYPFNWLKPSDRGIMAKWYQIINGASF